MRSTREGMIGALRAWLSKQPLVISFRKMKSGKSAHFPKSRISTRKHHRQQIISAISKVFLLVCLTVAVIAFTQQRNSHPDAGKSVADHLSPDAKSRSRFFEEAVQAQDREAINEFLDELSTDKSQPLAVRVDNANQKTALAQKLVGLSAPGQKAFAIEKAIDAYRESQMILFVNDVEIEELETRRLKKFIETGLNSAKLATRKAAALADTFQKSTRLSQTQTDREFQTELKSVINAIEFTTNLDKQDMKVCEGLIEIIQESGNKGIDNSVLIESFGDFYASSEKAAINELVEKATLDLRSRQFHFAPYTKELRASVEQIVDHKSEEIESLLEIIRLNPRTAEYRYVDLVSAFAVLSESAPPEYGKKYLDRVHQAFQNENAPTVFRDNFLKIYNAFKKIGNRFAVSSIPCYHEKTERQIVVEGIPTFLFFVEPDSIVKSRKHILDFENAFAPAIERGRLNYFVIFLGDENSESDWNRIEQITELAPASTPVWLAGEAKTRLLQQCPLPSTPTWIVIDDNGHMQRLNMSPALQHADIVNFVSN